MTDIFCDNNHLVLDQDRCSICGWTRPAASSGGEAVWVHSRLPDQIETTGLVLPAVSHHVVVFPLRNNTLVGLSTRDGSLQWETPLADNNLLQGIHDDGDRFLCSISDVRLFAQEARGKIAQLDPATGDLTILWQSASGQISDLALAEDGVYFLTGRPTLVALENKAEPQVRWEIPLQLWSAMAPALVEDRVMVLDAEVSGNTGNYRFAHRDSGRAHTNPYRVGTVQMQPVAVIQGMAFFQNGGRRFAALNPDSGEPLWEREFKRIYTSATAGGDQLYLVVRGPSAAGRHTYNLICLEAATGETCWERPIAERTTRPPVFHRNTVVIGTENGSLFALDGLSGEPLWQYRFPGDGEPVQTGLAEHSGVLYAATQSGIAAAVSLGTDEGLEESPEALLEAGMFDQAAAAYALRGDFTEAAGIYSEQLRKPEKALALLEHAGLNREAGELAEKLQLNTLARNYFRSAGDTYAEALVLIRMGDHLKAAQILEEIGELEQAAALYEKAQEPRQAMEIYKRLSMLTQVTRLVDLVTGTDEDISFLEQAGRLKDAARIAEKNGRLRKAVDLYFRAKAIDEEFRVLQALVEQDPKEWSLERLGQLASSSQNYKVAAEAWDKLERPRQAAAAYQAAAEQAEESGTEPDHAIADLYELATQRYREAGLHEQHKACYEKVVFLKKLPYIVVRARMDDRFREDEFNEVSLEIENTGPGLALDVIVAIGGERFEVDEDTSTHAILRLAGQTAHTLRTFIRPKPRQYGSAVPLPLSWTWKDRSGISYSNEMKQSVKVRRQDDSDISRPGKIHMQPEDLATSQIFPPASPITPTPDYFSRVTAAQPPVKILFLAANPSNLTHLSIDQEFRLIQHEVDRLPESQKVDIQYRGAVRAGDLHGLLVREKPDIVHFSGHGSPNGAIYVEDDAGGSHPIPSGALRNLFKILRGNIRLVVLNACFSEKQANAIAEHIDCVIGMSNEIEEEAARAFSKSLYLGIFHNLNLETAFNMGCNAIDMENLEDVLVPKILALRTPAEEITFFRK